MYVLPSLHLCDLNLAFFFDFVVDVRQFMKLLFEQFVVVIESTDDRVEFGAIAYAEFWSRRG